MISVAGQPFYTPAKTSTMSPQEQAFLIAGNLSSVFHDGGQYEPVWTNSENSLLVGEQPVMSLDGVAEADAVENRLRDILGGSKNIVKSATGAEADTANAKTKLSKSIKKETKANTDEKATRSLTMRQKLEAYYAEQNK